MKQELEIIKAKMEYHQKMAEIGAFFGLTTILVMISASPILIQAKIISVDDFRYAIIIMFLLVTLNIYWQLRTADNFYKKLDDLNGKHKNKIQAKKG